MAVIVIRGNARPAWLTGLASLCARVGEMARRALAGAAAAVMICAVGAALLQLAVEIVSFPAPIAVAGITVLTAALLNVLCRCLRARARHRHGPASRQAVQRLAHQNLPASLHEPALLSTSGRRRHDQTSLRIPPIGGRFRGSAL